MSIQQVSDFTRKIADKGLVKGLPPVKKSLKKCLLSLKEYIDETVDEYLGTTTFDDKTVAEWIYKENVTAAEKETYMQVNIFAARKTLKKIVREIEARDGGLNRRNIKLYTNLLQDFIHDVSLFIDYYKRKTDTKFVFLSGRKNYFTSSFETVMVARNLFYISLTKKNPIPYKESQGMVAMMLRSSIEIKTKRIFGIYKINKVNKRANDYGFKRLFDFIEANKTDIDYNPVDFKIFKQIYTWSCAYIHNGESSYLWQTERAFYYLEAYFSSGKYIAKNMTTHSAFGGFKLKNFNSLKKKLDTFIGTDYQIEYFPDNLVEAIIISK